MNVDFEIYGDNWVVLVFGNCSPYHSQTKAFQKIIYVYNIFLDVGLVVACFNLAKDMSAVPKSVDQKRLQEQQHWFTDRLAGAVLKTFGVL